MQRHELRRFVGSTRRHLLNIGGIGGTGKRDPCRHRTVSAVGANVDIRNVPSKSTLKPFSEMPGPRGLPVIGTLREYVKKGGLRFNKMFEIMQMRANQYGPIYKEKIGGLTSVIISDPEEYVKVIRVDGRYPNRIEMEPIVHYRNKRGMGLGTVNGQGEEWYRHRVILAQKLLRPMELISYLEPMNDVADDFMERLRGMTSTESIPNLEHELFQWALESVGTVLFEERIGCFNDPIPPTAKEFIENLVGFFKYLQPLMYGPPIYKLYPTKNWKQFVMHADRVTGVGQKLVNKKLESIKRQAKEGLVAGEREEKSAFLTYLLSQTSLTPKEVNSNCVDLMMGAVETTSNSLLWTLYCLSKSPEAQEALYEDTVKVLGSGPISAEKLQSMQYAKACFKETFRLYPITFATSRRIASDIEVCGYEIPKGTHCQANLYGMGRNEKLFPDPLTYKPERWLRDQHQTSPVHSLSNLPFGHGPRMCLGRRLAEQELYIVLSKIMLNFRIEYNSPVDIQPVLKTLMTPDRPVKLRFIPRKRGMPAAA